MGSRRTHIVSIIRSGLLSALLVFAGLATGCDASGSGSKPGEDDPALDEHLTAAVTLDGQRRLANFVLPESDDFSAIPHDETNPLTAAKVELGKLLFHEPALSRNTARTEFQGTFSCATCHHAGAGFQAGRRQAIGDGGVGWGRNGEGRRQNPSYFASEIDAAPLKSPSVLNTTYQRVMLWSGAAGSGGPNRGTESNWTSHQGASANHLGYDGLESQAISALSTHRLNDVSASIVATDPEYRALWDAAFPGHPVSDELAGLAIAAYERTVLANRAPFQQWLKGDRSAMTPSEKRGAIVFFGKGTCSNCHAGPALSQTAFYSLGMPDMRGPDVLNPQSENRGRGEFVVGPDTDFRFKVPQLYNLVESPFYGHGGTFESIREVVQYYDDGRPARTLPEGTVTAQFHPLNLTEDEVDDLVAFLTTALRDPDLDRYVPPAVPSGGCIPANDAAARLDLGCD